MCKVNEKIFNSVKSDVDTIYAFTKDGWTGVFSTMGSAKLMKVLAELIKRGAVSKTRVVGDSRRYHYQWVPDMAPTKNFYGSVAHTLSTHQRELDMKKRESEITPSVSSTPANLASFTIQQLWDELKSRGVVIEGGHLVIIKKEVLV